MQSSTSFLDQLRQDFQLDPIGFWVVLPDGSLAIVKQLQETAEGRIYRVQGIHRNGRFRPLQSVSCWFSDNELRLFYFSASAGVAA